MHTGTRVNYEQLTKRVAKSGMRMRRVCSGTCVRVYTGMYVRVDRYDMSELSGNRCMTLRHGHPVCLVGAPAEELRGEDLAVTNNPAFSKLIVIFAHLTTEVARLRRGAEETLFPTLVAGRRRLTPG